ncbi:hypothetical protein PIB30_034078 [Stylosanthes scabra]|uniref:TF-B3 domain-containing protein n=1 Tax=Stylosanthes scabra TaxID=79078 RepID=A0ABU6ZCB7_9FABA|nr:hypothetical protein [Stylosanthes scabra]
MVMASSSFQQNKHSPSKSNVIRFFKIIIRKALQDGNLKLPNKFTNKYGSGLPNPLYLKPPDGTEWKVDWTNHDDGILLEKGWKEFAAYYSLDNGHLLCFEYNNGTSHIEVHILDMSGLEIDYPAVPADDKIKEQLPRRRGRPRKSPKEPIPLSPSTSKQLRSAITTIDVDSSPNTQNIIRLNEGQQRKRLNEPLPRVRGRPRKKPKAPMSSPFNSTQLENDTQIRDVERSLNPQSIESEKTNLEMAVSFNQDSNGEKNRRRQDSKSSVRPGPARSEPLKEAKKFKWESPSFIIKITHRNKSSSQSCFSVKFFRKYFENNPQKANIRFQKEVFPAKLLYRPSTSNAYISTGWRDFAKASKLQAGDVCLFKLINTKDPELEVHICRRLGRESQLLEKAKELNSENPYLMVKIKNSNPRSSRPSLSGVFYRRYFKQNQQNVKLRFGKKLLPAKFIYNPLSRNAVFSKGWHAFAQANELEAGDVCFLELINGKDLLDVHICRAHYCKSII